VVAALAGAEVLGADETGTGAEGTLAWVHAARTETLTHYFVSTKRGVEAMTAAGVVAPVGRRTGAGARLLGPYWQFEVTHAVCGAHMGRELVAAAEVSGQDRGRGRWTGCWPRSTPPQSAVGPPAGPRWSRGCWTLTGAVTTNSSPPAGRPTPTITRASAASGDDPNTSTSWTASTPTATRCCATRLERPAFPGLQTH